MKELSMEVEQSVNKKGVISLMSVLILGAAAGAITIALLAISTENFTRSEGFSNTIQAKALAESCAEYAMDSLLVDNSYSGGEILTFGADSCTINPILFSGSQWTIQSEATYQNSTKRFEIRLDALAPSINIVQYEEVVSF